MSATMKISSKISIHISSKQTLASQDAVITYIELSIQNNLHPNNMIKLEKVDNSKQTIKQGKGSKHTVDDFSGDFQEGRNKSIK